MFKLEIGALKNHEPPAVATHADSQYFRMYLWSALKTQHRIFHTAKCTCTHIHAVSPISETPL